MRFIIPFVLLLLTFTTDAQKGIRLNTSGALESYTLFEVSRDVYLVDNCGEIVNEWNNLDGCIHHAKILPNGNLIHISRNGAIEEHNWDGQLVASTTLQSSSIVYDYEVIALPNGNYLSLGRRFRNSSFFDNLGYSPFLGSPSQVDVVIEVERSTGNIIWEWDISDHVIQERDSNKANYGRIRDNPQLLDMDAISTYDWENNESFMINGFDYNPDLDQIALSVRKISEVCIIDHSTTTEEAKGSSGGRYGKGGDILYRFGNPQNYGRGTADDRILYFQHNPNWIKYGPHKGKIIVYNNGLNRPGTTFSNRYSSIEIFEPLVTEPGNYVINDTDAFMPLVSDVAINERTMGLDFYSGYESGTQVLPNGHILLTVYSDDVIMEIDIEGEIYWAYGANRLFRSEKYPSDFPAFDGRDLTPSGNVEFPPSNYNCSFVFNLDADGDGYTGDAGDCDDENPNVNPGVVETPYNGIDDDCDLNTPDDDLDGDGFPLIVDCDDENPDVHYFSDEIPYNGLDDDCNEETRDDDLDEDGYELAEDCDDENDMIYPGAEEIPGNGIDEDCDGSDLSNITELAINTLSIYPNPASHTVQIQLSDSRATELLISLYSISGTPITNWHGTTLIDVSAYTSGVYLLKVQSAHNGKPVLRKLVIE